MKNILNAFLLIGLLSSAAYGQGVQVEKADTNYNAKKSKTTITIENGNVSVEDEDGEDTTRITWGNKRIIIVDNDETDTIEIKKEVKQRFNHFAGIDLGVNGFLSDKQSFDLQKDAQFMDLDYSKSFTVSLNFFEEYIPIFKEKFGISTGLGFEFTKYSLSRDVSLFTNSDTTFGFTDSTKSIQKNIFKTEMINWPIMLETNLGKDAKHSFHLAAGGMLSYRLGAKTKQLYSQDGKDFKSKDRADFNTNPFMFSLVARVGYGNFTIFANYSLTPLFEDNHGPEIYPFSIGISLASF